jgi:hypothetical protein
MTPTVSNPVVHLELRTANLRRACAFYTSLFGWRAEILRAAAGSYLVLELSEGVQGGIIEHGSARPAWVPRYEPCHVGSVDLGRGCRRDPTGAAARRRPAAWDPAPCERQRL